MSASGAANYFASDNYYSKDDADRSGQWVGKGAEAMGLAGQVDAKVFDKLLKGEKSKSETGDAMPAEAAMAESLNALNGTLKGIQLRESCRDLLAEAGVTPTTERMNTLVAAADDATRKKLVEAMPRGVTADPRKPAVMLRESAAAPVEYVPGKLVETVKRR